MSLPETEKLKIPPTSDGNSNVSNVSVNSDQLREEINEDFMDFVSMEENTGNVNNDSDKESDSDKDNDKDNNNNENNSNGKLKKNNRVISFEDENNNNNNNETNNNNNNETIDIENERGNSIVMDNDDNILTPQTQPLSVGFSTEENLRDSDESYDSDDDYVMQLNMKSKSTSNVNSSSNKDDDLCCGCFGGTAKRVSSRFFSGVLKWEMPDENRRQIIKKVVDSKKKLKKLIEKYGEKYVDDGTTIIDENELKEMTSDIDLEDVNLVIDKQSQKLYDINWVILRYLAREMPTPVITKLIDHYQVELARYPQDKVEEVIEELVETSEFPLATCLLMSAFFIKRSKLDLTNKELLEEYGKKYSEWAVKLLNNVESDYLATMMMMTYSFHDKLSPFNIALDGEIVDFLSSDRVGRIGHAMWIKDDLLEPDTAENYFVMKGTNLTEVNRRLIADPRGFYKSPMGFYTIELFLFCIYLLMFTILCMQRNQVNDNISKFEYIFFIFNFGYIFNEFVQLKQEGLSDYLKSWENYVDIILSVDFCIIILLRLATQFYPPWKKSENKNDEEEFVNVAYLFFWAVNSILLWMRLLHFLMLSQKEGPLLNATKQMLNESVIFGKVFILFIIGFMYASYFIVGDTNFFWENETRAFFQTFLAGMGQPNWEIIGGEDHGDDREPTSEFRADLNEFVALVFQLVGFVVLFNLLIAMMAYRYDEITERSNKEVLYNKIALTYELDHEGKIMPAPLNSVVFVIFILYSIFDLLLLSFTAEFMNELGFSRSWRCRNKLCKSLNSESVISLISEDDKKTTFECYLCHTKHSRKYIIKNSKRRFRRKPRGLEGKKKSSWFERMKYGWIEIFSSSFNPNKHSWLCGYCRARIPKNFKINLDRYCNKLKKVHRLDEDDVLFIKSLAPTVCPNCYRKRTPRSRGIYVLENISYLVFFISVFPLLRFLLLPWHILDLSKQSKEDSTLDGVSFKTKYEENLSIRPNQIQDLMPKGLIHQSILNWDHSVWNNVYNHRESVKKIGKLDNIINARDKQQEVEKKKSLEHKHIITDMAENVLKIVDDMSKASIIWDSTSADLQTRVSILPGKDRLINIITTNGGNKHNTTNTNENISTLEAINEYEVSDSSSDNEINKQIISDVNNIKNKNKTVEEIDS